MADINIQQIPDAPGGYSLTGKKLMVHDQSAPLASSTVLLPATSFGPGSGGGYAAPLWEVDGAGGSPVAGAFTFVSAGLIGATEMNYIIVNKVIEIIGDDFTFDNSTGTITRINQWITGDKMITPYKPV